VRQCVTKPSLRLVAWMTGRVPAASVYETDYKYDSLRQQEWPKRSRFFWRVSTAGNAVSKVRSGGDDDDDDDAGQGEATQCVAG
jgi:hypothetical protein